MTKPEWRSGKASTKIHSAFDIRAFVVIRHSSFVIGQASLYSRLACGKEAESVTSSGASVRIQPIVHLMLAAAFHYAFPKLLEFLQVRTAQCRVVRPARWEAAPGP